MCFSALSSFTNQKNWTLLPKHVYVLQSYYKKHMDGKIPPRHQIMETLDAALEESW